MNKLSLINVMYSLQRYKYVKVNPHTVTCVEMFYLWQSLVLTKRIVTFIVETFVSPDAFGNCFPKKEKQEETRCMCVTIRVCTLKVRKLRVS